MVLEFNTGPYVCLMDISRALNQHMHSIFNWHKAGNYALKLYITRSNCCNMSSRPALNAINETYAINENVLNISWDVRINFSNILT